MQTKNSILEQGKLFGHSWGTKKFYCEDGYLMLDFSNKGKKQLLFAYFHRGGGPIE